MAGLGLKLDVSGLVKQLRKLDESGSKAMYAAMRDAAFEVLRLSSFEVPHDKGGLQNSGTVDTGDPKDIVVGYNTPYAARLHEHPEYRFQKGRKGKYLEDPIKNNQSVLLEYIGEKAKEGTNG